MDELLFNRIQQALSEINPKVATLYFENLNMLSVTNNCFTPIHKIRHLIDVSFTWSRTPEGFVFWKEVCENPIIAHKHLEATRYDRNDFIKALRDCKRYYLATKGLQCLE